MDITRGASILTKRKRDETKKVATFIHDAERILKATGDRVIPDAEEVEGLREQVVRIERLSRAINTLIVLGNQVPRDELVGYLTVDLEDAQEASTLIKLIED